MQAGRPSGRNSLSSKVFLCLFSLSFSFLFSCSYLNKLFSLLFLFLLNLHLLTSRPCGLSFLCCGGMSVEAMCLLSFLVLWSCSGTVKTGRACPVLCSSAGENAEQMGSGVGKKKVIGALQSRTLYENWEQMGTGWRGVSSITHAFNGAFVPVLIVILLPLMIRRKSTACHKIMPTTMLGSETY